MPCARRRRSAIERGTWSSARPGALAREKAEELERPEEAISSRACTTDLRTPLTADRGTVKNLLAGEVRDRVDRSGAGAPAQGVEVAAGQWGGGDNLSM